jgi:hypothetical protein
MWYSIPIDRIVPTGDRQHPGDGHRDELEALRLDDPLQLFDRIELRVVPIPLLVNVGRGSEGEARACFGGLVRPVAPRQEATRQRVVDHHPDAAVDAQGSNSVSMSR